MYDDMYIFLINHRLVCFFKGFHIFYNFVLIIDKKIYFSLPIMYHICLYLLTQIFFCHISICTSLQLLDIFKARQNIAFNYFD